MPEKDTTFIVGFLATIGTALALFGVNVRWIHNMTRQIEKVDARVDKIPEKYIMKEDFNHRVDRLEGELKGDISKIFDIVNNAYSNKKDD